MALEAIFLRVPETRRVRRTVIVLLAIFLITQASTMVVVNLITVPAEDPGEPRERRVDYIEGGETIKSSLQVYAFLVAGVGLIALAIRLKLGKYIFRNLESVIILLTTFLLFFTLCPESPLVWVLPAVGLVLLKRFASHWAFATALSIYLASVVGGIMGVSLGLIPIMALMGFLSVYDIVAVKMSSHMGNVVKNVRGTASAFLVEIPGLRAAVGISDLAVPAMFVGANALLLSPGSGVLVALGGGMGLVAAVLYSDRSGMVPALPFIFAGTMAAYLLGAALQAS
jgi:presenilin-like A22 family membrane protease